MADLEALVATVAEIRIDLGAPAVVIHNAPRAVRGSILDLDPTDLEKNFRVNVTALLYLARETVPAMLEAGKGAILVTGNTSATRGKSHWGFFASTKAAQRILAEIHRPRVRSARDPRRLFHHRRGDQYTAYPAALVP